VKAVVQTTHNYTEKSFISLITILFFLLYLCAQNIGLHHQHRINIQTQSFIMKFWIWNIDQCTNIINWY